jgi:SAM-dependent methyltransferase
MSETVYNSAIEALEATNCFYEQDGFSYAREQVRALLELYVARLPETGDVLDLCCGDGVWAAGIKQSNPRLRLFGIDISEAGIQKARTLLPDDAARFVVGDAEQALPWPNSSFDLVFARGPGLYNQHSMDRAATIRVIEMWHRALKPTGTFVSVFYSDPARFGTYTNPLKVRLPYNRAPRLTEAVDFTGGKFHHDVTSFLTPFRKARNVMIAEFRFERNYHILTTRRVADPDCPDIESSNGQ